MEWVPELSGRGDVKEKQDRQHTYNVTLRRVHERAVTVEKQEVLHIYVRARARVRVCVCVWGCTGSDVACARVALIIQNATSRNIVICCPSAFSTFFDIIS
jgi:hypothetical protein